MQFLLMMLPKTKMTMANLENGLDSRENGKMKINNENGLSFIYVYSLLTT